MSEITLTRFQIAALKNLDKVIKPHRTRAEKLRKKMVDLQAEVEQEEAQVAQMEAIANQQVGGEDYRNFIPGYYDVAPETTSVEAVEEVTTESAAEEASGTDDLPFGETPWGSEK